MNNWKSVCSLSLLILTSSFQALSEEELDISKILSYRDSGYEVRSTGFMEAFGATHSKQNGQLYVSNVDLTVPLNGPDITISRSIVPSQISLALSTRINSYKPYYDFENWSLDIPKITVMSYWGLANSYLKSCISSATTVKINVPGNDEFDAIGKPANATYPQTAVMRFANNWIVGCESYTSRSVITQKNGSTISPTAKNTVYLKSPDGTIYYFGSDAVSSIPPNPANAPPGAANDWSLYEPILSYYQVTDVVDKFGNWIAYDYKQVRSGSQSEYFKTAYVATKIRSGDGAVVTINRNDYKISSISYGGRTLEYQYDTFSATVSGTQVSTPYLKDVYINKTEDTSKWSYRLLSQTVSYDDGTFGEMFLESITNPFGATMSFQYEANETLCGRNGGKPKGSINKGYSPSLSSVYVSGNGISPIQANFSYQYINSSSAKTVTTIGDRVFEDTYWIKQCDYGFGVDVRHLTDSTVKDSSGNTLKTSEITWKYISLPSTQIERVEDPNPSSDLPVREKILIDNRYETVYSGFDSYGNPTIMTETDLVTNRTRKNKTVYYNRGNTWIIGLKKAAYIGDALSNYTLISNTSYHGGIYTDFGVPNYFYNNSTWTRRVSQYHTNGLPKKIEFNQKIRKADQTFSTSNRYILYEDYFRGEPRKITVPSRYSDVTKDIITKTLDNYGRPLSITNPLGIKYEFSYDAMGRVKSQSIKNDQISWLDLMYTYTINSGGYGLQQLIEKCRLNTSKTACTSGSRTASTNNLYDSLLRNISINQFSYIPTFEGKLKNFEYDEVGNKTFESYWGVLYSTPHGITTEYDALNRITSVAHYNTNPTTHNYTYDGDTITDPNGNVSVITYWNYGSPQYELIESVEYDKVTQTTGYDLFDNLTTITLSGTENGYAVSQTQHNVYDNNQRLCKTIRNDTGTSVFTYNIIGEIDWQADLGITATSLNCDSSPSSSQKAYRAYDNHGGLYSLTFSDGITPNQYTKYNAVGNLIETRSDDVVKTIDWYGNSLIKSETLTIGNQRLSKDSNSPSLLYGYNQGEALSTIQYPDGDVIRYSPNGFGQPTEVIRNVSSTRSEYIYAEDIAYHPNGMIHSFYYGNGLKHETQLNSNEIPYRITDERSGQTHLDYQYTYDDNFNTKSITDLVNSSYSINNIIYDYLDRVTDIYGNSGIGNSIIKYDPLGNIRSNSNKKHSLSYTYDPSNYRVSKVVDSKNANNNYNSFGYDIRGNIYSNGKRTFTFNALNQIVSTSNYGYKYDASGKRVYQDDANGENYSLYSQSGKLLYGEDGDGPTNYIFLQSKLIAKDGYVREFKPKQHYTAFGSSIEGETDDVGYTGHKYDKAIGLSYMQARYYDPVIGRFYSNDPIGFRDVHSFNRYAYANNNPYKYTDPTGMASCSRSGGCSPSTNTHNTTGTNLGPIIRANMPSASTVADFTPIVGDIKGFVDFANEPSVLNGIAAVAGLIPVGGDAIAKGLKALPDSALVARGGANITPQSIENAISTHPSGVTGFSAQCNGGTCLNELGANIPNGQMGVTTVGDVRAAGGDVVVTSGRGNHVTVTGLDPNAASQLLSPSVPNPVPKQDRNL